MNFSLSETTERLLKLSEKCFKIARQLFFSLRHLILVTGGQTKWGLDAGAKIWFLVRTLFDEATRALIKADTSTFFTFLFFQILTILHASFAFKRETYDWPQY